jgi:hypothetical protein
MKAREDLPPSLVEKILCEIPGSFTGYDEPQSKDKITVKTFTSPGHQERKERPHPTSPNLACFTSLRESLFSVR